MTQQVEIPAAGISDQDFHNLQQRQVQFAMLQRIAALPAGAAIQPGILGPGQYAGGTLANNATVYGVGWPTIAGIVTVAGVATVQGVVFSKAVNIAAAGIVRFIGCTFLATVTLASGAKATFSGCLFDTAGYIDNTANVLAECLVGDGVHTSSQPHLNVLVMGEVS